MSFVGLCMIAKTLNKNLRLNVDENFEKRRKHIVNRSSSLEVGISFETSHVLDGHFVDKLILFLLENKQACNTKQTAFHIATSYSDFSSIILK